MSSNDTIIASDKTIQGDEYAVTENYLIIHQQDEIFMFDIIEISHEGVIEWEEADVYAFAFHYQGASYEFPSLYPYYSDLTAAIKEARKRHAKRAQSPNMEPLQETPSIYERSYPELIAALEQNQHITIHERISLVNYVYKRFNCELRSKVGASERASVKNIVEMAAKQNLIELLEVMAINRFRLIRNDLVHGRIEFFPTDLLLRVYQILQSIFNNNVL